jgi:hypothetical protein
MRCSSSAICSVITAISSAVEASFSANSSSSFFNISGVGIERSLLRPGTIPAYPLITTYKRNLSPTSDPSKKTDGSVLDKSSLDPHVVRFS